MFLDCTPQKPHLSDQMGVMPATDLTGAQETTKFHPSEGKSVCGWSLLAEPA